MYQVKIVVNCDSEKLTKDINEFLTTLPEESYVDIKYSSLPLAISSHTQYGVYPDSNFTAMIIYKKSKE